jgi:hypothetical protein
MKRTSRLLLFAATLGLTARMEASSTVVNKDHPQLAVGASDAVASVYFIRQKDGFYGVTGMAVSIRLGKDELLKLAKGQYTLVRLKPWEGEMVVKSWAVTGSNNSMTKVEVKRHFAFEGGHEYYVALVPNRGGLDGDSCLPVPIDHEQGAQLAARLKAVGDAVETPLVASPKAATP